MDAHRNALNSHCYWLLRRAGMDAQAADARLDGLSAADKNELLFQYGTNFNDLPLWQKRGVGVYWVEVEKEGYNPLTGKTASTWRRKLHRELELPMKDDYDAMLQPLIVGASG